LKFGPPEVRENHLLMVVPNQRRGEPAVSAALPVNTVLVDG
jgi:hypothetical protein